MNSFKFRAVILIAVLSLLPNVAASADAAKDAYEKGNSCLEKKDYDAAITAFTEAIRLNPEDARAYNSRGICFENNGKHDEAIADFTEAIRLNPSDSVAYANRGHANFEKADLREAIADAPRLSDSIQEVRWRIVIGGKPTSVKATSTRPSLTIRMQFGSTRNMPRRIGDGAEPTPARANMTRPLPTAPRPSS